MTGFTVTTIVRRLTGNITPVGDSGVDLERLDNLCMRIAVVEELLGDIAGVANNKDSREHSVRACGTKAFSFLKHLAEEYAPHAEPEPPHA